MSDPPFHPKIAEFTREVGNELGLDRAFVDFVLAKEKPGGARWVCEPVDQGWSPWVPDDCEAAYPIWSNNADQMLLLRRGTTYRFAQAHHDCDEVRRVADTVQGLLTDLFITLWEGPPEERSELEEVAARCGFRYLAEVIAFEAKHNRDRDFEARRAQFVANIDARPGS